ncbi:hypothetical protein UT300012_39020 [Paraclostridium bifermentans]
MKKEKYIFIFIISAIIWYNIISLRYYTPMKLTLIASVGTTISIMSKSYLIFLGVVGYILFLMI